MPHGLCAHPISAMALSVRSPGAATAGASERPDWIPPTPRRPVQFACNVPLRAAVLLRGCSMSGRRPGRAAAILRGGEDSMGSGEPSSLTTTDTGGTSSSGEQESTGGLFSGSLKGLLMLNVVAILFATNQVAIKTTEESCPPGLLSAVRFSIAAACFAPSIIKGFRDSEVRNVALELGVYLTGGYLAQATGLTQTTATHGALTVTFTVMAVPLYVGLAGGHVSMRTLVSAAVALFGVGLLTTDGTLPNLGDAWCILAALIFAFHKFRSESVTRDLRDKTHELMGTQLSVLALGSIAAATLESVAGGEGLEQMMGPAASLPWLNLIYMGGATTALTLWMEAEALKEVSAPLAVLIYTMEPLWAAGFAYFLMGDRWGPQGWVGGACIVAASLTSQILEALERSKEEKGAP